MIVDVVRPAAGVPVPGLGSPPPSYVPSVLVVVLGVIAVAAIIWFVVVCLRAGRLVDRGRSPLRVALVSLVAMVVTVSAATFVAMREQGAHKQVEEDYSRAIDATQSRVLDSLETYYKVTIPDPFDIPLQDTNRPSPIDTTSAAGGSSSCWVATVDGVYDIRCGGSTFERSEPLQPVSR
ncbi:hypothetical protein BH11ACT1_BH11ACT1_22250 [soil metagenome]